MNGVTSLITMKSVVLEDRALRVYFEDGKSISFEDCWLRDHCRCASCYHADTFQRAKHIINLPDSKIEDFQYDGSNVTIRWDDEHISSFSSEFLSRFDYKTWKEGRRLKPQIWHGNIEDRVTKTDVEEFLGTVEGSKRVFQSLLDYGVALIVGVDVSLEATEIVCKALGGIQHTFFGGMWTLSTKGDHADTSYTNLPLAAHNDNTYFTEAAGLQIFHCLQRGTGGETILVDGFYGAQNLKEQFPKDFEFLTNFDVEAEFLEEGRHYSFSAPVITVDSKTQDLTQIRFNVYDRTPMAFENSNDCRSYYRSLRNLAQYYQDPDNQWVLKLKPGTVIAIDNFRVLHGRTAFTGSRLLCGSYISRSDWLNKARTLGLIQ